MIRRSHAVLMLLCCLALVPGVASAQTVDLTDRPDVPPSSDEIKPRGEYTGVKPGGSELPAVPAAAGATPVTITWPGFQMRPDGSSRVFLQATSQLLVGNTSKPGKFFLHLGDARIAGETNRFPLVTKFFNSPVTRATLKQGSDGTVLVLDLRQDVEPKVTGEQAPSGFYFVYVDFPAGNYLDKLQVATATRPGDPQPAPTARPTGPAMPDHLEGEVGGSARGSGSARASGSATLDTSMDAERPPGMGEVKAKGKAKGEVKGEGKGKAGFSF